MAGAWRSMLTQTDVYAHGDAATTALGGAATTALGTCACEADRSLEAARDKEKPPKPPRLGRPLPSARRVRGVKRRRSI